jgi:hypothetical protein
MLEKYELPKISRYLLTALFLPVLYSMYLAGYGPFNLSRLGAFVSLPVALLAYWLTGLLAGHQGRFFDT